MEGFSVVIAKKQNNNKRSQPDERHRQRRVHDRHVGWLAGLQSNG